MTCVVCGSEDLFKMRPYRVQTALAKAFFGDSWIATCNSCALVQATPLPSEASLEHYYSADYWAHTHGGSVLNDSELFPRDNLALLNRGQSIAQLVAQYAPDPHAILDVGSGYGHILHALGEKYPDARRLAVEPDSDCRQHLQRIGVDEISESLACLSSQFSMALDVVVLSHTLEHLRDPIQTLSMLAQRLTDTGLLCVEVPNASLEMNDPSATHPWLSRFDEPHLTFFSKATLAQTIQRAQLQVVFCETVGPLYKRRRLLSDAMHSVRSELRSLLPTSILRQLSRQRLPSSERSEDFYQYAGPRIWLRCLAKRIR